MVSLQQVDLAMFPQIYPLLQEIDPHLSEAEWYSLFTQPWHQPENYCGYGLFDDSKMVGFLGLIFSQRKINGQIENFCNLSSWIVKEAYRGHAISLLLALRKLENYTITDLSPTEKVSYIFKRLGFQELDTQIAVLPNILGKLKLNQKLKIITDLALILPRLKSPEQSLLQDQSTCSRCQHLLAEANGEHCYIIFTLVNNAKYPYSHIQYLGNPELFARYSLIIRQAIAEISGTLLVLIDQRLLQEAKPAFCFNLPIEICKLYKSSSLKPEQIDNLYSELIILDFNPIPPFGWREVINYIKEHRISSNK